MNVKNVKNIIAAIVVMIDAQIVRQKKKELLGMYMSNLCVY